MKMLKQGSLVNPTVIFKCSVCGSVFSANINELEMVGFQSAQVDQKSGLSRIYYNVMYQFFCPVCEMKRYAVTYKEEDNDKN